MSKGNKSKPRLYHPEFLDIFCGGVEPQSVQGQHNVRTAFYRTELYELVKARFELKCPEDWNRDYIYDAILLDGKLLVCDSVLGVKPFECSLAGQDYTRRPIEALVAVPTILSFRVSLVNGEGALVYVDKIGPQVFYSFMPLIQIYAEQLADMDASISVNGMNTRLTYVVEAESSAQAATIKEVYDRTTKGEPLVVARKDSLAKQASGNVGLQAFFGNVKNNFLITDLQDAKRTMVCEFLTRIGFNNANTDKKERLITDEVNANNQEIKANTTVWKETLDECNKKVNQLYPEVNFSFKLRELQDDVLEQSTDVGNKSGLADRVRRLTGVRKSN